MEEEERDTQRSNKTRYRSGMGLRLPNTENHSQWKLIALSPSQRALTMLSCPAETCTFKAKSDRSLTVHIGKCKKAAIGLASIGEDAEQREVDDRRAKRRRISSPKPLRMVEEDEEPMDIDLGVRFVNTRFNSRRLIPPIIPSGRQSTSRHPTSNRRTSSP